MLTSLALAARLFTSLPALTLDAPTRADARRAIALLPLAGAIVGLATAAGWGAASRFWTGQAPIFGAIALLVGALMTGGRGFGGLARAADGLAAHGSGGERSRAFAVMREPRRGTAGLVAVAVSVAVKFAFLTSLPAPVAFPGLILTSVAGAWAVAFAYAAFPLASTDSDPETSSGLNSAGPGEFLLATVLAILAAALLPTRGLVFLLVVAVIVGPLAARAHKTLGGLNRPLCAALGEVAELVLARVFMPALREKRMNADWKKIEDDVWVLEDSCKVYAVTGTTGTVIVNAGTGLAAEHLDELPKPVNVLLTHAFRDHADGAIRLHDAGAEIWGNIWDANYYLDPEQHFRERLTWNSYDNRWDRFAPIRPIPITHWLRDYENVEIAELNWEIVPTPGVTVGASSYLVTLPNGRRLAFVGEILGGPDGKIGRIAPLQYNYNDLSGAANIWHSCNRILDAKPNRLLPSLGEPMDDPPAAIAALKENLKRLDEISPGIAANFYNLNDPNFDEISEVLPRLWHSVVSFANTYFVLGKSGRVLSLDYGYNNAALKMPDVHHVSNRRPLLHGLDGLRKRFGIEKIDTVLVTHYHDDHVCGIPLLQRLFGTEVWVGESFADLLARPERYDRPCLWQEPINVSRALPCGVTHQWEDITFTLFPMSGHTRFSALILLEIDGVRVAHTGDQIFFQPWEFEPGARLFTNHVYKNSLDLGGYRETLAHLEDFRPDWILTGHTNPYQPTEEWYAAIAKGAEAFDDVHRALLPLADDDVHFGPDSQGGELRPYRVHQTDGGPIAFDGWIRNPFGTQQTATIQLAAPDGWHSDAQTLSLAPHAVADFVLTLTPLPGTHCRRQPVALDLTVAGRPFGQIAEALVTLGEAYF